METDLKKIIRDFESIKRRDADAKDWIEYVLRQSFVPKELLDIKDDYEDMLGGFSYVY